MLLDHLMLVPSLTCPARCRYCFGPRDGHDIMSPDVLHAALDWADSVRNGSPDGPLEIVFHGGEPLTAGAAFFAEALARLRSPFGSRKVRLNIQSNLWLLTEGLCDLFVEHGVSIGTSLDGPEPITDAQRGGGYFQHTMAGVELARSRGLDTGCICTFTRQSAPQAERIFDFFLHESLDFTIHHAVMPLTQGQEHRESQAWALTPEEHGELLVALLDFYLPNLKKLRIGTLDLLCRSVSAGEGRICTFRDCLGEYLAVGPDGAIYPCQRFAGNPAFELGRVQDAPSRDELESSPVWRMFRQREERVQEECGHCAHFAYCRGGCPYDTLAVGNGRFQACRDPNCAAYKRTFTYIVDRALSEVFSDGNLQEVVDRPGQGLLRRGPLLTLMGRDPHPRDAAGHARRMLAAVALATIGSAAEATHTLQHLQVLPGGAWVEQAVTAMHRQLTEPVRSLNNLYLHVTFRCNLQCAHCYAQAGPDHVEASPVEDVIRACREGAGLRFRHAVITGGEPLLHPERDALLDALAGARDELKPLLTVLRTNLSVGISSETMRRIACSTDEVVVSLDGDRDTHDARRGQGTCDVTVANLRRLVACHGSADVSLATVLPASEVNGAPGESVRSLADELGIRRIRFRPLLPLGRAKESEMGIVPEALWGHLTSRDMIGYGFTPTASCGLGQNLYVKPNGGAYPCYAWQGEPWRLGGVFDCGGLAAVVASDAFRRLAGHTVDRNRKCRGCVLRYLCGGACRAWGGAENCDDLDAPPPDCAHLRGRADAMLTGALDYLEVSPNTWVSAGLPVPPKDPARAQEFAAGDPNGG